MLLQLTICVDMNSKRRPQPHTGWSDASHWRHRQDLLPGAVQIVQVRRPGRGRFRAWLVLRLQTEIPLRSTTPGGPRRRPVLDTPREDEQPSFLHLWQAHSIPPWWGYDAMGVCVPVEVVIREQVVADPFLPGRFLSVGS